MKKALRKNRILPPLFFFISGILLADFVENQWLIIVIISPLLGIISLCNCYELKSSLLLPVGLLFISQNTVDKNSILKYKDKIVDVEGIVYKSLERSGSYTKIYLDVKEIIQGSERKYARGKIIIYAEDNLYGIYRGYRVRILDSKLYGFRLYKNPGNFDVIKYYQRKGIYLKAYLNSDKNIISFGRSRPSNPLLVYVDKLREKFGIYVRNNTTFPASEIYTALTTGDKKGIPAEIRESFSSLGIAHIIAISGLHVGAVALIFYILIDWLLKRSEYILLKHNVPRITALLAIIPVIFYMIVAGLATPVVRAALMLSLYLLSVALGRNHSKLNTLGVAAFIILIWEPSSIYDLSFQLSFVAVAGILLINNIFPFSFTSLKDKFISSFKCTIAATIFTAPLVVNSFGTLPVLSIPSNIMIIPIVEFIIVPQCLLSFMLFTIYPTISKILVMFNGYLIELLINFADSMYALSFSRLTIGHVDNTSFILLYITIVLIVLIKIRPKIIYLALSSLIIFTISITYRHETKNLLIAFPDSGKKIYSLVHLPKGKKILINATSRSNTESDYIERNVISNYLLNEGITKIDYMIILSSDSLVLEGSKFLINKFAVDHLFTKDNKLINDIWMKIYSGDVTKTDLLSETEPLIIDNTKFNFYINRDVYYGNNNIIIKISHNNSSLIIGDLLDVDPRVISDAERINNFRKADVIYMPEVNNSNQLIKLISFLKPKNLITRVIDNGIKYKIKSVNPDLHLYETASHGLTSVVLGDDLYIDTPYR